MNTQRILKVIVVVGLLALASTSYAAVGTWTRKADMPTARWGLSTGVVDGKIYAIGGGQNPYSNYLSTVEVYDPKTDTWTRKADMPTGRAFAGASVVNGKIYVVGGSPRNDSSTTSVEEYDPATDRWTRKTNMPTTRCFLSTSAVNGKIYAMGGAMYPGGVTAAVEEYDPATDTWTRRGNMATARLALSTTVIDGKIYVVGGIVTSDLTAPAVSSVQEYDPATDSWTTKAHMPTARAYLCTSVVNGKIYAIGGTPSNWTSVISTVEEYDPVMDTWTKKDDMPTAREFPSTSVVDGKVYAIGGSVVYWPWTPTSTVEEYVFSPPPPDFNGDGIVDGDDLLILIEHWGQDDPMCDIAPPPFGDGIVDVEDLKVLAGHIGKGIDDPTLVAHWALDETTGMTAADSAGDNDALVLGNAAWQPAGGKVQGALQFDGKDDFLRSGSIVLDPAAGPFSAIAWVKGGAPNRVIVSQFGAADWLYLNQFGMLATDLKAPGRVGKSLTSDAYVLDDQWHRVAVVWDRTNRTLQMDGVEVARDTQPALAASSGNLHIGGGKNLTPASLWSGLIDDVRVYSRAVAP